MLKNKYIIENEIKSGHEVKREMGRAVLVTDSEIIEIKTGKRIGLNVELVD